MRGSSMESSFRLGFVHFDRSDQDRYLAVLKQLKDSGAVDELGVGQIRDYYSGLLFPGFSVLQQHAKYFVVLPLLFKDAVRRRHDGVSQVKQTIRKLEIELTRSLVAACPADSGITGCDSQAVRSGNGRGDYVKYDPMYIYRSGLKAFGIVRTANIENAILGASARYRERPVMLSPTADEPGDLADVPALMPFCDIPEEEYDWRRSCSLKLTRKEAAFLRNHMMSSDTCRGSLLHHILENMVDVSAFETFDVSAFETFDAFLAGCGDSLPGNLQRESRLAAFFSDLVDGLYLFYNWLLAGKSKDGRWNEFLEWRLNVFRPEASGMVESLGIPLPRAVRSPPFHDDKALTFCQGAIESIRRERWGELERKMVDRERACKQSRQNWKLGKEGQKPVHDYKVDFRWKTVRTIVGEIREGLLDE